MSFPRYPQYKDSGVAWLGEVPAHWEVSPLKRVVTYNDDVLNEDTDSSSEILYVDISNVDAVKGITAKETYAFASAPSRARRRVSEGDVIISTVRTYLRAIARLKGVEPNLIVSTGFAVIRPQRELISDFAGFMLSGNHFIEQVIARSSGISYPAINASELVQIPVAIPPKNEQCSIARFLERETSKIDSLVDEQQRLIELLQEKRQAVIAHAVTKGLNPDAPMKPSGVEWLGEVPAHWECLRNKVVFEEIDERSTTDDGELLTVSHITGVTPRAEKEVNMFLAETLEGYKKCQPGDLVINTMWAWMGALGISPLEGLVSPSYNVYRPRSNGQLLPSFYDFLCRIPSHRVAMKANSTGVWESRLRLYPDAFLSMKLCVPPIDEQQAIVEFLKAENAKWDALIAEAERAIALLRERRQALISAAVTGQIDVRQLVDKVSV